MASELEVEQSILELRAGKGSSRCIIQLATNPWAPRLLCLSYRGVVSRFNGPASEVSGS